MIESIRIAHEHMGIKVINISDNSVSLSLPYPQNTNDKQTLFAGSIFSVATLAGWTLAMHHALKCKFPNPWAAVTHIEGDFLKPIKDNCIAIASFSSPPKLEIGAKNWLNIEIKIDKSFLLKAQYAVGNKH